MHVDVWLETLLDDKEKTLLPVDTVIPIVWYLRQCEERDQLLTTFAKRMLGSFEDLTFLTLFQSKTRACHTTKL